MSPDNGRSKHVVVIGAGPAGLTAAYQLCQVGIPSVVVEKDVVVGGLARTASHNGYHFDIGGHRFFTKVKAVEDMWREVLPDGQFLRRPRLSRIYYDKQFFHYPLRPVNALFGLGLLNSLLIVMSYFAAQMFPQRPEDTFDRWVSNRFGKRLYRTFFKTYTEKVWGIPCNEIRAEWAAQRIQGLSLLTAVKNALLRPQPGDKNALIKTLIDEFDYPARGPGMMWETVTDLVRQRGGQVLLGADVRRIRRSAHRVEAVDVQTAEGAVVLPGTDFISSMPVRDLIECLDPLPPAPVLKAARELHYRDFLTVALIIDRADLFPDNWIYVHDPEVRVGRIQNFKNWSPAMVPDPRKTCLGLEYFCFEGDDLWAMADDALVALATKEIERLGLARASEVVDGAVVRMAKAYPVYDGEYAAALTTIRQFLASIENLQLVGRNGMHKYNNQDHSMLTAMLAVRNLLGGQYDLWKVNADQEYHEERSKRDEDTDEFARLAVTQPQVPRRKAASGR
jgi:protoporphyrinogen oxidase